MFNPNVLYYTDAYKISHKLMMAPDTSRLYGTEIPRSLKYGPKGVTKVMNFGKQIIWRWINDHFQESFFKVPKEKAMIFGRDMAMLLMQEYDSRHFEELYNLGYLPIKVCSLPEGIEVSPNIPTSDFINTKDGFAWLTLYLETIASSLSWKPMLAATIALQYKKNCIEWVKKTDPENMWLVDYLCHDFSARGSNPHDMISIGLGHATCFRGSDTLLTIPAARYYYDEPHDEVVINSVSASEHSVSTTKIFTVGEKQMLLDWLKIFPKGILSWVIDTFSTWKAIEYASECKEEIMKREGKLVFRADSGDPVDIICGLPTIGNFHDSISMEKFIYKGRVYRFRKENYEKFKEEFYEHINEEENYQIEKFWEEIPLHKNKVTKFKKGKIIRRHKKIEDIIIEFKDASPNLYKLATEIISGKKVEDQTYSSETTDNQHHTYNYFKVENGEIVAVGTEQVREGGWYWFKDGEDLYEEVPIETVEISTDIESVRKGVIELLWDTFGGTINEQGYKVLDPHVGAIYGDSITLERQVEIYKRLEAKGFAATNIVLGIGSFTYMYNTRDSIGLAYKGAWFETKNEIFGAQEFNIYKDPITDDGTKRSLKGFQFVYRDRDGEIKVLSEVTEEEHNSPENMLQPIFIDGEFYNQTTLSQIRKKINEQFN